MNEVTTGNFRIALLSKTYHFYFFFFSKNVSKAGF